MPYRFIFLPKILKPLLGRRRLVPARSSSARRLDTRDLSDRMAAAALISRKPQFEPVDSYVEPDLERLSLRVPTAQPDRTQRLVEAILLVTFAILATMYFF